MMIVVWLYVAALLVLAAALVCRRQSRRVLAVVVALTCAALVIPAGLVNTVLAAGGNLQLENLDTVPYDDRLVFNKLQNPAFSGQQIAFHDLVKLELRAVDGSVKISNVAVAGPWRIEDVGSFPITIASGSSVTLNVRFTANGTEAAPVNSSASGCTYEKDNSGVSRRGPCRGSLTISSDAANIPTKVVQLAGFWQRQPEGSFEPSLRQIVDLFGYKTAITRSGQSLDRNGQIDVVGDEVLSPYWRRADASQPVKVHHLAAYHTQGNSSTVYWHPKGSSSTSTIVTQVGIDGQTVLPRRSTATNDLAVNIFTPNVDVFGFRTANEWSDPNKNDLGQDYVNNCPGVCGHHVRFWAVRDRSGLVVPNQYLMAMDYLGINYDYNDNVYLVSNIVPENPMQNVLYRLDTGVTGVPGNSKYTYSGNVWTPDRENWSIKYPQPMTGTKTFFTPGDAIDEGGTGGDIAGTDDDALYRTYRGRQQDQVTSTKTIDYALPTSFANIVDVRLHFADRAFNTQGSRIFDVLMEGEVKLDNYDIVAKAGGQNRAIVEQINGVQVTDGVLNISLQASVNFPSIAGIEVLCNGSCTGADTTAPATPTGLTATPSDAAITLDWNSNSETDFKEYRVFRSDSANGPYSRIAVLSGSGSSQYTDTSAPRGVASFYRVTAVDNAGNESGFASASATRPAGTTPVTPTPVTPTPVTPTPTPTMRNVYLPMIGR